MQQRESTGTLRAVGLALLAGLGPCASALAVAEGGVTALHCGHLVDTVAGTVRGESTVLVSAGRITAVQEGNQVPEGATPVELGTMTCLPGLIDSHTHLTQETSPTAYNDQFRWNLADSVVRSTVYARRTLMAGFTTVRNLGDDQNESVALRNAINAGVVPGPRIYTAGQAIGPTATGTTSRATRACSRASSTAWMMPRRRCASTTSRAMTSSRSCPRAA